MGAGMIGNSTTMLSRTADSLYWLGRYVERAENGARLLDGTHHLNLLPLNMDEQRELWRKLFQSDDEVESFLKKHNEFNDKSVIEYLTIDPDNRSSILSCIEAARDNTRAARAELTTEISQCMNQSLIDMRAVTMQSINDTGISEFLDFIKERTHLFKGVIYGTMRRGEPFLFWELGTALERAENTSRLIMTRAETFHRVHRRDDGFDFYRWGTFLRSANAYSAYRQIYGDIDPVSVAEMLILNTNIPRSLLACIEDTKDILKTLRREAPCAEMSERLAAEIRAVRLDQILRSGLGNFLNDFRKQVHALSDQIRIDFMMVR
ncbi:MAG: alpha-E domain-containing protein [Rhodospirillales bacterium]